MCGRLEFRIIQIIHTGDPIAQAGKWVESLRQSTDGELARYAPNCALSDSGATASWRGRIRSSVHRRQRYASKALADPFTKEGIDANGSFRLQLAAALQGRCDDDSMLYTIFRPEC